MPQIALYAQKALFAPKMHLGLKCKKCTPKVILKQKVHFCDVGLKRLHLAFVLIGFGEKVKMLIFMIRISKKIWKK